MARKRSLRGTSRGGRWFLAWRWIGLAALALGCFWLAALLTVHQDPWRGLLAGLAPDGTGSVGSFLALAVLRPFGWAGAWLPAAALAVFGGAVLFNRSRRVVLARALALAPWTIALGAFAASLGGGSATSGAWGTGLRDGVGGLLGGAAGAGALGLLLAGSTLFNVELWDAFSGRATRLTVRTIRWIAAVLAAALRKLVVVSWITFAWAARMLFAAGVWAAHALPAAAAWSWRWFTESFFNRGLDEVAEAPAAKSALRAEPAAAPRIVNPEGSEPGGHVVPAPARSVDPPSAAESGLRQANEAPEEDEADAPESDGEEEAVIVRKIPEGVAGEADFQGAVHASRRAERRRGAVPPALFESATGDFPLPSCDLLDEVPHTGPSVPESELVENSRILTETLRDFGVSGRVGEVHPGPVITRYEFTPGPGVRVAQILNRSDDLALKLRAIRIRIVAPIPGKAAVGIEVPNHDPKTIYLRALLESKAFVDASGPLPIALGKDINGYPVITELTKMPHLLIAGTTGSGKSVCVNGIVTSLLLKNSPRDLRLLMVDPKMLELPMYNGIPHLLTDVVTDPKMAARSLKWLILEMERRYRILAARGSRNIQSYNAKFDAEGPLQDGEERLPYVVVLIDELADLMMVSGNEVEEPIARLAQTARAVGIHLIVATQRPSVDVLTGVIKANFPSRIAFQVASRIDSRTILDQNGAEALLGRGDMLFLPPAHAAPLRVHGAFVSETETQRLVGFLRKQGKPVSNLSLEEALAESEARAEGLIDDPLFEDAARLVVAAGQGSASLLQRRLKVGYSRAGRLVDMLESAGILTPSEGSKPRDVLIDAVHLEHLLAERETSAPL